MASKLDLNFCKNKRFFINIFFDKPIQLTFRDINGLVEQNVQLRSLVRSLSDQLEDKDMELKVIKKFCLCMKPVILDHFLLEWSSTNFACMET